MYYLMINKILILFFLTAFFFSDAQDWEKMTQSLQLKLSQSKSEKEKVDLMNKNAGNHRYKQKEKG